MISSQLFTSLVNIVAVLRSRAIQVLVRILMLSSAVGQSTTSYSIFTDRLAHLAVLDLVSLLLHPAATASPLATSRHMDTFAQMNDMSNRP